MILISRIKETFALSPKLQELKAYSYLIFALERLFLALQQLSPATWFLGSRRRAHDRAASESQWQQMTQARGKAVELYVLVWSLFLTLSIWLASSAGTTSRLVATILAGLRAFDIMQTVINVTLFDHFRIEGDHSVSGITRTVVLGLWNYLELIVCFGVLYAAHPLWVSHRASVADAYYFSAITQLTIGYGDLKPLALGRLVSVVQGLAGLLFLVIVFARFVALIPKVTSVQPGDRSR